VVVASAVSRRGPGVYAFSLTPRAASGEVSVELFDGDNSLAPPIRVQIAADGWRSRYASRLAGGCGVSRLSSVSPLGAATGLFAISTALFAMRRRLQRKKR
jgi:hypothetical protein